MMTEEKKQNNVKRLSEKMSDYGVTKRSFYAAIGIVGCLFLTIVMSIVGTNFNPDVFMTWSYWVSTLIQSGLSIYSMITGHQIGDDTQKNKKDGQYRIELKKYETEYNAADALNILVYFDAWLDIYRDKKLKKKIKETLLNWGIKQPEVLDLDLGEVDNLKNPYRKDWAGTQHEEKYWDEKKKESVTKFKSLSEDQINVVKAIMQGEVKVPFISPSYFLNALKGTSTDEWNRASKSNKKKGGKLASGYSYRIAMLIAFSVATNGLMPMPYEESSAQTMILNIASRIFAIISSLVWGVFLGFKTVEMDMISLAYKKQVIKEFKDEYKSGEFKPETVEQEAEREYDEYMRKQSEEETANV